MTTGEMTVSIETVEQTYFLQCHTATGGSSDEAAIDIVGRIESALKPHDSYVGLIDEIASRSSRLISPI
ncbi:hypothetical protein [Sphingomonas sp. FUKUSWIS1]|uniref:hypothetical protein n=1 Tax=Sphingomonas sp. FUKUSWIS1 TaxID=1379701 RepID=UPI0009DE9A1C|nr:hypothetical protein [Sphingomonas sp. FUKUSWIS1]